MHGPVHGRSRFLGHEVARGICSSEMPQVCAAALPRVTHMGTASRVIWLDLGISRFIINSTNVESSENNFFPKFKSMIFFPEISRRARPMDSDHNACKMSEEI